MAQRAQTRRRDWRAGQANSPLAQPPPTSVRWWVYPRPRGRVRRLPRPIVTAYGQTAWEAFEDARIKSPQQIPLPFSAVRVLRRSRYRRLDDARRQRSLNP